MTINHEVGVAWCTDDLGRIARQTANSVGSSAPGEGVVVIDDVNIFNAKLQEWQDYYYHRPHGGLDGQTPNERLRQKTQTEIRV